MYNKTKTRCNKFVKLRNRDNQIRKSKQSKITEFFGDSAENKLTLKTVRDTNRFVLKCLQINHQKRLMSTENAAKIMSRKQAFLILGQEPSTFGNNVTGLCGKNTTINANVQRPRAYIHCSKSLNAWSVEELCSRDTACCIMDTKDKKMNNLLIQLQVNKMIVLYY